MSPNGMGDSPVNIRGYKTLNTTNAARITSYHTIPIEQFIHNVSESGDCLCGPDLEYLDLEGGPVLQAMHMALDATYYEGLHWDWGPDGPDPVKS